eukprot:TRINITY_DN33922_c0_g1_i1.p1 TRINITY_DN33922_c0_g1~~TRINITY_DN33922_c0_g1_i1.p1  ORF type:complete len:737 (+),score=137.13 TRINITY_DN33922_c0_g1_i1:185-2395(+)
MGNRMHNIERSCVQCMASSCAKGPASEIYGANGDDPYGDDGGLLDGCNPVGTIFAETLEDLSEVDRQLLLFATGSNLVGVRWLLALGANKDAADLNGTTALHAACRMGFLPIIRELVDEQGVSPHVVDSAGWTPLHVATAMEHRGVVHYLLQRKASMRARTNAGQTPMELCRHPVLYQAMKNFLMLETSDVQDGLVDDMKVSEAFVVAEDQEGGRALGLECGQYEPYFVPRRAVVTTTNSQQAVEECSRAIFNRCPGRGLAFLVATGCVRDAPAEIYSFFRRSIQNKETPALSLEQLGSFIGERHSLAIPLRLEIVQTVKFLGSGVIAALVRFFQQLRLPADVQKVDRLVHAVATAWWKQHEKHHAQQVLQSGGGGDMVHEKADDITGLELQQYISGPEALYQLMFSTVMLNWHLHGHGSSAAAAESDPNGIRSLESWLRLNRGIQADGDELSGRVLQHNIFRTIQARAVPELLPAQSLLSGAKSVPTATAASALPTSRILVSGWALVSGVSAELDDKRRSGLHGGFFMGDSSPRDTTYLSLYESFLFLSTVDPSYNKAPYAFIPLSHLSVERIEGALITLVTAPAETLGTPRRQRRPSDSPPMSSRGVMSPLLGTQVGEVFPFSASSKFGSLPSSISGLWVGQSDAASGKGLTKEAPPVQTRDNGKKVEATQPISSSVVIIFLLADGRWQERSLPRLELQVLGPNREELQPDQVSIISEWEERLRHVCVPSPHVG